MLQSDVDGDIVLAFLDSAEYVMFNRTASAIWEGLETPVRVDALIRSLGERFNVGVPECSTQVLSSLSTLVDRGLVIVTSSAIARED